MAEGINFLELETQAQERARASQRSREAVISTSRNVTEQLTSSREGLLTQLRMLNQNTQAQYQNADRAMMRVENMAQNPAVVNTILGFFDPDFNKEAQLARLQRSQMNINNIKNQMQHAATQHEIVASNLQTIQNTVEQIYNVNRQGFADTENLARFGIAIRGQVRKEQVDMITDASERQLAQWRNNPTSIPPALQGKEGIVQMEILRRRANELNINMSEFNFDEALENERVEDFADQFSSTKELAAAIKSNNLPEGVAPGAVQRKLLQLQGLEADLAAAEALANQRNFEMSEKYRKSALERMTSKQLRELLSNMDVNSRNDIAAGAVSFKRAEVQTALASALDREKQEVMLMNEAVLAEGGVNSKLTTLEERSSRYANLLMPGADPDTVNLPAPYQAIISDVIRQDQVLQSIGDQPGVAQERVARLTAAMEETDKQITEFIKNSFDDADKPAINEYLTNGRITNPNNAAALLINNAPNPNLLGYNEALRIPYSDFATTLSQMGADINLVKFDFSGDNIEFSKGEGSPSIIIEKAIKDSNVRNTFVDTSSQILLQQVMDQMIKESPNPENSSWLRFYNPDTNRLSQEFYVPDPDTGERVFSWPKFRQLLARASVDDIDKNALGADLNYAEIAIDRVIENLQRGAAHQLFANDPYAAAFNAAIFSNQPHRFIREKMFAQLNELPMAIKNARSLKTELETTTERMLDIQRKQQDLLKSKPEQSSPLFGTRP